MTAGIDKLTLDYMVRCLGLYPMSRLVTGSESRELVRQLRVRETVVYPVDLRYGLLSDRYVVACFMSWGHDYCDLLRRSVPEEYRFPIDLWDWNYGSRSR